MTPAEAGLLLAGHAEIVEQDIAGWRKEKPVAAEGFGQEEIEALQGLLSRLKNNLSDGK